MQLDFSKQIKAARSGPKSAAQTPAEPEERKKDLLLISLILLPALLHLVKK